jgi:hypothetical protein
MLFGRRLVMTTTPTAPGRVRLSAYLHGHRLGTCAAQDPAGRAFTCRVTLGPKVPLTARIVVAASMRVGVAIVGVRLPAAQIPQMKMRPVGLRGRAAGAAGTLWCSPSTLAPVLVTVARR